MGEGGVRMEAKLWKFETVEDESIFNIFSRDFGTSGKLPYLPKNHISVL